MFCDWHTYPFNLLPSSLLLEIGVIVMNNLKADACQNLEKGKENSRFFPLGHSAHQFISLLLK